MEMPSLLVFTTRAKTDFVRAKPMVCERSFPQPFPQPIFLPLLARVVATPSSHERTFATVTVCSSSGAFTLTVSRVPGASGISARTLFLNAAIASTAASKKLSAGTRTECSMPSESVNETRQEWEGTELV